MRIHVIRARTLPAALQQVRENHGENAIVLDTATAPDGVTIRVGVELDPDKGETGPATIAARMAETAIVDHIGEALAWHGVPALVTRSLLLGVESTGGTDAEAALAAALERVFRFCRPEALPNPLAIVGPPGSGKTAVMAKLAAARRVAGGEIAIVNADLETAGAQDRIAAFAAALGVEPASAASPAGIQSAIYDVDGALVLIDTSGRAPADADDISEVSREIEAAGDGLLVLGAAIAPVEAAELAECFAAAGATHLIVTQLDIARRVGALLAAADAGDLVIAGASLGRKVGAGLHALGPKSLARLILTPPQPIAKPRPRRPKAEAPAAPAPRMTIRPTPEREPQGRADDAPAPENAARLAPASSEHGAAA